MKKTSFSSAAVLVLLGILWPIPTAVSYLPGQQFQKTKCLPDWRKTEVLGQASDYQLPGTLMTNSSTASEPEIYLCSLQWTPDEQISKPCRDLWKWKDSTLGDGRDFFVPKPKTIRALQSLLQKQCGFIQVSVLSNCARLAIICVSGTNPVPDICRCLMAQVHSRDANGLVSALTHSLDVPEWVLSDVSSPTEATPDSKELEQHWEVMQGKKDVLYHLCRVAAGMASRPRRPEREVVFRPFSSRDAHILLQLKRTKEVAQGNQVNQLLEYALRAGKAARNTKIVPALSLLREYGTGDSKYCIDPPRETLAKVSNAVVNQAIEPLVAECLEAARISVGISDNIAEFRSQAERLASTNAERVWMKARIHQPTMDLRNGRLQVEILQEVLQQIQKELAMMRSCDSA